MTLSHRMTPPMGWNSWNALRCQGIREDVLLEAASAWVDQGLADAGYRTFVLDDCWQAPGRVNGRLVPDPDRFPRGMAAFADDLRARGLQLGMYLTPGRRTCAEIYDSYGDGTGLGSFGHEEGDLTQLLGWGIEFLKYDWCKACSQGTGLTPRAAFARMASLLDAAELEIVYSVSEYGKHEPWLWASEFAHMWRTTPDISARWRSVLRCARATARVATYTRPGHVNDPDMLEVGNGRLLGATGWTHLAIWAMLAAPLFAGNDPRTMKPQLVRTLCDPVLIALDQDPMVRSGTLTRLEPGLDVWTRDTSRGPVTLVVNTWPLSRRVDLERYAGTLSASKLLVTDEGRGAWSPTIRLAPRSGVLLAGSEWTMGR